MTTISGSIWISAVVTDSMEGERPSESFENWIEKIARGDSNSFGQFYDAYTIRLYSYLLVLTRSNERLAEDMHQTVMIKVARNFKRFSNEDEIWPWLCQIARNSYVDHIRKDSFFSRLRSLLRIEAESKKHSAADDEELYRCLERAMAELEGDDSALLNSVYFENKTQKEIALDLVTTPKAIERRLSRIRQELRAILLKELKT